MTKTFLGQGLQDEKPSEEVRACILPWGWGGGCGAEMVIKLLVSSQTGKHRHLWELRVFLLRIPGQRQDWGAGEGGGSRSDSLPFSGLQVIKILPVLPTKHPLPRPTPDERHEP